MLLYLSLQGIGKKKPAGLDEEILRNIEDRLNYLILLQQRKETDLKSIEDKES